MEEYKIKPVLSLYTIGLVTATKTLFKRKEKIFNVVTGLRVENIIIHVLKTYIDHVCNQCWGAGNDSFVNILLDIHISWSL